MRRLRLGPITEDDCRDIWLWRNHPDVRRRFFNTKPLSWRGHKRWFYSKIKDSRTKIYIANMGSDKIGIIRFEIKKRGVAVSVNLNPDFFGKGFGSKVIKMGTDRFFAETERRKPIFAEIKKDNIASQKAFQSAGYSLTKKKEASFIYERR